jgi:hypothetical protein
MRPTIAILLSASDAVAQQTAWGQCEYLLEVYFNIPPNQYSLTSSQRMQVSLPQTVAIHS